MRGVRHQFATKLPLIATDWPHVCHTLQELATNCSELATDCNEFVTNCHQLIASQTVFPCISMICGACIGHCPSHAGPRVTECGGYFPLVHHGCCGRSTANSHKDIGITGRAGSASAMLAQAQQVCGHLAFHKEQVVVHLRRWLCGVWLVAVCERL